MSEPIVVIDDGDRRELSVDQMVENLRQRVAGLPVDLPDARCALVLMDVMPGFIRALDRERKTFQAQCIMDRENGLSASQTGTLDDFMMVMTMPLVNMLGTMLLALVPCKHDEDPCQRCEELRVAMMKHVIENLERGVRCYATTAAEREFNGPKLHS